MGKRTRGGEAGTPGPAALSSSYAYNVRGWLTGIGGSLFSETLAYETPRPGSLDGEWGGNISSATWKTAAAPSDSTWYDYGYDRLGRLVEADYGSSASSAGNHGHSYWYDLNGNMTGRESPGQHTEFAAGDRQALLSWTFSEGNAPVRQLREYYKATTVWGQPHPWQPPRPVIVMEPETLGRVEEYFTYDAAGNRTATRNAQGDTLALMRYNLLNLPQEYVTAAGDTVWYVYSADGEKLFVKKNLLSGPVTGTEYAANYRIENGTLAMIHTDAGYYTPVTSPGGAGSPSYMHVWYLKDHLGNNRVLADGGGNALAVHDYAPYGDGMSAVTTVSLSPFPSGASGSPYRYGGKEWSVPTSTYDFEARQFSPYFHRFTSMDPLAEKYYSISPYAYCANDPVNVVDPEGMVNWRIVGKGALTIMSGTGTTAGGAVLATGTGGLATPLSAYLVFEGISEIGFGIGILTAGLVSDNSSEMTSALNDIPTGATNSIAKTIDTLTGDENHSAEKTADVAQTIVTAGTSIPGSIGKVAKGLVLVSNGIGIASSSNYVTTDTSESQIKKGRQIEYKQEETPISPVSDEYYLWNNENRTIY